MTVPEQIAAFVTDIEKVIDRYRSEFDLPMAAVLGSLEIVQQSLVKEAFDNDDEAT